MPAAGWGQCLNWTGKEALGYSLNRGFAAFAGADTNCVKDLFDEDLAVAVFARPGILQHRLNDSVLQIVRGNHFQLRFQGKRH